MGSGNVHIKAYRGKLSNDGMASVRIGMPSTPPAPPTPPRPPHPPTPPSPPHHSGDDGDDN